MNNGDRTAVASLAGICFMCIVLGALLYVDWSQPKPLLFLIPDTILLWIALYNVGKRT